MFSACAVSLTAGKSMTKKLPRLLRPRLVTPDLSRRRAYRRAYVASPRVTTTDVGLTLRLAYAHVVHTAPGESACVLLGRSVCVCVCHTRNAE